MKRTVILAPSAQKDRKTIKAWFRQPGSGQAARARLAKLQAGLAALATFPLINRPGPVPGTRMLICQGHKVIYEIEPGSDGTPEAGDVVVLRIYGPGQSDTGQPSET